MDWSVIGEGVRKSLALGGSPILVGALAGLAIIFVWMALAPSGRPKEAGERLEKYLDTPTAIIDAEVMSRSFSSRVIVPGLRKLLGLLGRMAPKQNVEKTGEMLVQGGSPMNLSVLDFFGLRILAAALFAGGYLVLMGTSGPILDALMYALLVGAVGYLLPKFWLGSKVRSRKHDIQRALPDALDMLTIGVEVGLGFESAMMRVGEKWENALTREFRRSVAEMRVGSTREEALLRMAGRCGVPDLRSFVAILVQSSKLGVSIAEVLHTQADQMRVKRRQRAEELARQAGIKMVFPLVFFIFPALFVVILGPAIPGVLGFMGGL